MVYGRVAAAFVGFPIENVLPLIVAVKSRNGEEAMAKSLQLLDELGGIN